MKKLPELAAEWIEAKDTERDAVERRRLIEDEICRVLDVSELQEGTRRMEAKPFTIKFTSRINRKVDSDLAQEIAAEENLQDHLQLLFRWKPELNLSAWEAVSDNVRGVFSRAITATPGRPSFTITEEN